jgi:ferrochelatase
MPYLERLLHFFKSKKINFKLRHFTPIPHFEAIFTNSALEQKEFGASDKVLIFEPSFELVESQIAFLKRQANWAKIIYIIPEYKKEKFADEPNIFTYRNKRDIIEILKNGSFHFALIAEQDKSLLAEAKRPEPVQLTLF